MRKTISLALLLAAAPATAQVVAPPASPPTGTPYQRAIAAGYKALTLCSAMFIAGRTQEQVERQELRGVYPEYDALIPTMPATISPAVASVEVPFDPALPPRLASRGPVNGCVLSPIGGEGRYEMGGEGSAIGPKPADPRPWPLGDGGIAPVPSAAIAPVIVKAFDRISYGAGDTVGVVVLHDGRIVAERYADGFGPLVANRTWSVAKSITGTLIGIASAGKTNQTLAPARSAPIPAWSSATDPRHDITLDNLLRMASGLHSDTAGNRTDAIYFGGTAVDEQAPFWPIEVKPGTRFRYANNDILLAAYAMRQAIGDDRYGALPAETFRRLGMTHTVAERDVHGNFILSSQVWSTARDLARLGQFWLQDGVWQGRRVLPAGWMTYMTTPSGPKPATGPGYGATLWLFGPNQGLPEGSYAAQGNRGQYVMVIPSRKLVIVRRGEDPGAARFDIARFSADVAASLSENR